LKKIKKIGYCQSYLTGTICIQGKNASEAALQDNFIPEKEKHMQQNTMMHKPKMVRQKKRKILSIFQKNLFTQFFVWIMKN